MSQQMVRDKDIDRIRGFATLQVIFVHVLYWTGLFSVGYLRVIKSFFLFEMPLFFFVTGAVNRNQTVSDPIKFVLHRITRIIVPYWIFALLNICVIVGKGILNDTLTFSYAAKAIITWIIPYDRQCYSFPYSTWALWFVPVYILCIVLLPCAITLKNGKHSKLLIPIFIVMTGLFAYLGLDIPQKVCFYMIWVCIGFNYDTIKRIFTSKPDIYIYIYIYIGNLLRFALYSVCYGLFPEYAVKQVSAELHLSDFLCRSSCGSPQVYFLSSVFY